MKTWFIDFQGYCEIEAATEQEAKDRFWNLINEEKALPSNIYEIVGTEEKGD